MTSKKNSVFVYFSDGQKHKYLTTATIPQIRKKFPIGQKYYITEANAHVQVEAITIY